MGVLVGGVSGEGRSPSPDLSRSIIIREDGYFCAGTGVSNLLTSMRA